jgi:hypothetical protein
MDMSLRLYFYSRLVHGFFASLSMSTKPNTTMKNTTMKKGLMLFIGALIVATAMKVAGTQPVTQALSDAEMLNIVGGLPEACKALAYCLVNQIICAAATLGCFFGL